MNRVVHLAGEELRVRDRLSRNGMFVFTPRTRNSCRQRSMRRAASTKRSPLAVTFTSSES